MFKKLSLALSREPAVLLLDEFQWLAAGRKELVSDLKYAWDNFFLKSNKLHLILCGSVSSFMVKKVIRSKALYGRIDKEINLLPLSWCESAELIRSSRSIQEQLELYLVTGGIPLYLRQWAPKQSVSLNINRLCFEKDGFFVGEFSRIFVSHFGRNPIYRKVVEYLARVKFASRDEIKRRTSTASGGTLSDVLEDLELAGFISIYGSKLDFKKVRSVRYRLADPYLLFYFRFIAPNIGAIEKGRGSFERSISANAYAIWRGLAFEQFCRTQDSQIAAKLGFGSVQYTSGAWYDTGAQVDLLFLRKDDVISACEIKFQTAAVGKNIIPEFENKVKAIQSWRPRSTIEKVLITVSPPSADLEAEGYFQRILRVEDLELR